MPKLLAAAGILGLFALQTGTLPQASAASSLPAGQAFGTGVLGALVGYLVLYRTSRINAFWQDTGHQWKVFAFDFGVYLLCGGLVTTFVADPSSPKAAFIGGLAWQSLVGGFIAGEELKTLTKETQKEEARKAGV
jgi:hypothetical protein